MYRTSAPSNAPDDGADDVVEVDPDVGLTPEDKEELVLEVGPDGQNKKIIQTDRLIIQGQRYIRIFLEAEGKTVEAWTERVAQLADGRGWSSDKVQEELKRMLQQWQKQVCESRRESPTPTPFPTRTRHHTPRPSGMDPQG